MSNPPVFSTDLILPYSAINANGRVKVDWLLNAFQDVATQQCMTLRISGFDMAKKQLKWVVAQYQIKIHDIIGMMPLTLKTWRAPWKNLYEIRQYALGPQIGPPLVTATSIWILIKAKTGKPVRLTPHMPTDLMEQSASKAPGLIRTEEFGEYHHETRFPVRFLDLDLNQHVNNRVYLKWAVESLPEPYCFEYAPTQCTVIYRKEGLYGDQVLSRVKMDLTNRHLITSHSILKQSTGEELARLNLDWIKRPPTNLFQP